MNFFIVGVGRSGTSLLQSIISSHSKISIPPETGFVRRNILSKRKKTNISLKQIVESNYRVKRIFTPDSDKLPETFTNEIEFYRILFEAYSDYQNKMIIGDKDPRLVEFVIATSKLFPDASFIHLVRDPRDILLSKKNADWSKGKPAWYHIFANYVQLRLGKRQGKKLSKDKYLEITYEDLLDDPETYVATVCEFLRVEFEPEMLSFQTKAKELVSNEERQWKKETLGPLLKNNTGKWKGMLNNGDIALTELLCDQAFNVGGYKKSNTIGRLNIFKKVWIYILSALLKVSGTFYILYRLTTQLILVKWKY